MLSSVFPEVQWKQEWFHNIPKFKRSHWLNKTNSKTFLDNIANELGILNPLDWRRVNISLIRKRGGEVTFGKLTQ